MDGLEEESEVEEWWSEERGEKGKGGNKGWLRSGGGNAGNGEKGRRKVEEDEAV